MRDRRRQLVGFSVAALLLARRRACRCAGVERPLGGRRPASPRRARSPSSRRSRDRPKTAAGRPTTPIPTATPTRFRRRRARPPAIATSASTGSPRGSTHPRLADADGGRHPRFRRAGARGRRIRPRGRERDARLARAEERRLDRRRRRQDRRLPLPDRRRTVRLRGPRPRPGDQAAPDPTAASRLPGPRQRLQRLRVPRHLAVTRPQGDARPRVQPHPPVRLRRLPGPLVRRVQRDLDGGPGLQRRSTTTCATCAAG